MALGAFGSYLGGAVAGLANTQNQYHSALDLSQYQAQQSAMNQLMNMNLANQQSYGNTSMLSGLMGGAYVTSSGNVGIGVPPPEPKPAKRRTQNDDDPFRATDDHTNDPYFTPGWKRRLMKRYGANHESDPIFLGSFVRRLAFEIDMWHQNAAGLPA